MVQTGCKVRLIYVNPLQDFSYSKLLQLKRAFLITENLTPCIFIWWFKLQNPSTRELILNGTSQEPSKFPEPRGPKYLQRCLVQLPRHARPPPSLRRHPAASFCLLLLTIEEAAQQICAPQNGSDYSTNSPLWAKGFSSTGQGLPSLPSCLCARARRRRSSERKIVVYFDTRGVVYFCNEPTEDWIISLPPLTAPIGSDRAALDVQYLCNCT